MLGQNVLLSLLTGEHEAFCTLTPILLNDISFPGLKDDDYFGSKLSAVTGFW